MMKFNDFVLNEGFSSMLGNPPARTMARQASVDVFARMILMQRSGWCYVYLLMIKNV